MSYPSKYIVENNINKLLKVITAHPLATLISVNNNKPCISHIPFIHLNNDSTYGKLVGHLDLNNPQVKHLKGAEVCAVFHGPNVYISPTIYETKNQVPTWNFIKIEVKGRVTFIDGIDNNINILQQQTNIYENGRENPWQLDVNNPRMQQLINYIQGIEIDITEMSGIFKLSQNKSKIDQIAAMHEMNKQ